jgi:hypothetical protein
MRDTLWIFIAVLLLSICVPSSRAQTPVNINTSSFGESELDPDFGTGASGIVFTPSYAIYFTSGPDTNYSTYFGTCPPQLQLCEAYNASYGPGGAIYIYNSSSTQLLFTGSFTDGTGSGVYPPGGDSVSFSGDFTLNGINGSGNLSTFMLNTVENAGTLDFSGEVTPEPGTLVLALLGASVIVGKLWLIHST